MYLRERDPRNATGAVAGGVQTAPRSEEYAVARVLTGSRTQVTIITDKKAVWRKLRRLQVGRQVKSMHQADWDQVARRIHRVHEVHWAKPHLDGDGAEVAAAIRDYPVRWHELSAGADSLAAARVGMHTDDPGLVAQYHWMLHRARLHWRFLLVAGQPPKEQGIESSPPNPGGLSHGHVGLLFRREEEELALPSVPHGSAAVCRPLVEGADGRVWDGLDAADCPPPSLPSWSPSGGPTN